MGGCCAKRAQPESEFVTLFTKIDGDIFHINEDCSGMKCVVTYEVEDGQCRI